MRSWMRGRIGWRGVLVGQGVGAESVVGLCWRGRCELVVAMLAVWKAGRRICRWIRRLPAERVAFMLADAGAGVCGDECGGGWVGLPAGGAGWWWWTSAVVAMAAGGRRLRPVGGPGADRRRM